ncbi:PREDICTED: ananain-like, partial [Rhagoletis zephyria]|uniref:ananain-like n=1 Tax=Rhagoletis zephyria TaxID=28612 RepID=UPI0008117DD5
MYDSFDVDDIADSVLPSSFDYRDLDVVSVVKNQGGAQTCYLFAALSAVESAFMLSHRGRRNVSFSEKDAYNCLAKLGYNDAPQVGGQVETVYRMFMETHGIVYEKDAEQYDFTRKDYETPPK